MLIRQNANLGLGMYPDSNIKCWTDAHKNCTLRSNKEPIRRLQRAIDSMVNQIPIYNVEGYIDGPNGRIELSKLPRSPIGNSPTGYDGDVGPTTLGWFNAVIGVALQLKPGDAYALQAKVNPIDADYFPRPLVQLAEELAVYLEDVAGNFAAYYEDWKRVKTPDPALAPPPMIIQTNQPLPSVRSSRWKTAGIAMAGLGLVSLVAWGMARYNEKSTAWDM